MGNNECQEERLCQKGISHGSNVIVVCKKYIILKELTSNPDLPTRRVAREGQRGLEHPLFLLHTRSDRVSDRESYW